MPRSVAGDPSYLPPRPYQPPPNGHTVPGAPTPSSSANQPGPPTRAVSSTPTLSGLFNAYRRRWVLGTLLGLLVAAGAAAALWVLLPGGQHQARVVVQVRSRHVELARHPDDLGESCGQLVYLLKSRDLIARTIAGNPAVENLGMIKNAKDPVGMIAARLRVEPVTDTLIEVTLIGDTPDEMKLFLDQLIQRFVDDADAFDRRRMEGRIQTTEQLAESLREQVGATKRGLDLVAQANHTVGGEEDAQRLALHQQRLVETEAAFHRLGRELAALEAEADTLREQLDDKPPAPDPVLVNQIAERDPNVATAKAALDLKVAARAKALDTAGGNAGVPYVRELQGEVEELQKAYEGAKAIATAAARAREDANRKQRLGQVESDLRKGGREREQLREERDALHRLITTGAESRRKMQALGDRLRSQQERLDAAGATLDALQLDANLGPRVSAIGEAERIPNHNQARRISLTVAGGLASLFGVVLLVAFLEWQTRRVAGVAPVVNELGLRVIGTVPAFPGRATLKSAVETGGADWRFALNESINSTRTMLLHAARAQSMRVVMITSATSGEGKTSLASQLGASMAAAGMRALVVDCDLRNPSIHKLFDLPLGPGVADVLCQEADASDAVQATAVPNLWVIPAGRCSHTTLAALARGHLLETLFNRLRGQFDFVLVDSPPVLPVADALIIGQHADGAVLSIMQEVSQLPKVAAASDKLRQLDIALVGAVVSGIRPEAHDGYDSAAPLLV